MTADAVSPAGRHACTGAGLTFRNPEAARMVDEYGRKARPDGRCAQD